MRSLVAHLVWDQEAEVQILVWRPDSILKGYIMTLISLIVVLVVIGVILWLVNAYIPMDGKIKQILNVVVVIFVVLWLLQAFGLLGGGILNMRI